MKYKAFDGYSYSILTVHSYDGIDYMLDSEIPAYLWEPFNRSFFGVRPVLPVKGQIVYAHDFLDFIHYWRHGIWKISDKALFESINACWKRTHKEIGVCAPRGGLMCTECKNTMPFI